MHVARGPRPSTRDIRQRQGLNRPSPDCAQSTCRCRRLQQACGAKHVISHRLWRPVSFRIEAGRYHTSPRLRHTDATCSSLLLGEGIGMHHHPRRRGGRGTASRLLSHGGTGRRARQAASLAAMARMRMSMRAMLAGESLLVQPTSVLAAVPTLLLSSTRTLILAEDAPLAAWRARSSCCPPWRCS